MTNNPKHSTHHRILNNFSIPSSRGMKAYCEICNVKFQLLVKQEHQCKRCMRSVCEDCGPERRTVYEYDGSWALHRCCLVCIRQIEAIQEYINTFKLCFGQDSEFVEDWATKLNKQHKDYDQILNEYTDSLTLVTNDNTIRFKRDSEVIMDDFIASCHYSLRDFIHLMTHTINPDIFHNKVIAVMTGVYARLPSLPYVPELVYLCVFFLSFANEAHSYFIMSRLIEKIYPQYVRVKKMKKDNLLSSSLKTILEMYRICVDRVDRNELQVIAQYLQSRFEHYIISFTLNVCSMPNSFYIIDEMLKSGNYLALYKGIAGLMSHCREELASYKSFSEVEIPMLREVSLQNLKNCFIKFEKTDIKFEVSNDVFDSAEHRKLYEKYKQMESLYGKLQASLNDKEAKLKQMSEKLSKKSTQLEQQTKKVTSLQLELLKLSDQLPQLTTYATMEQQHSYAITRNEQLQKKCEELQLKIEQFEKDRAKYQKYNRMWKGMENDYVEELKQLKTRNQILQIKVAAKEIDFNTSFIERKLQDKNNENAILKGELDHVKNELDYYKLKTIQNRFSLKSAGSKLKLPNDNIKDKEFKKHIEHSCQLVQTRTRKLQQATKQCQEKGEKIEELEGKVKNLEDQLKNVQEISDIIKAIPEEFSYEEAIGQLERTASKQSNFMKKKTLESATDSFRNCHKELKFRIIDARIKQQRIKNSVLIKLLDPSNISSLEQAKHQPNDELFSIIKEVGADKKIDDPKNGQCSLM